MRILCTREKVHVPENVCSLSQPYSFIRSIENTDELSSNQSIELIFFMHPYFPADQQLFHFLLFSLDCHCKSTFRFRFLLTHWLIDCWCFDLLLFLMHFIKNFYPCMELGGLFLFDTSSFYLFTSRQSYHDNKNDSIVQQILAYRSACGLLMIEIRWSPISFHLVGSFDMWLLFENNKYNPMCIWRNYWKKRARYFPSVIHLFDSMTWFYSTRSTGEWVNERWILFCNFYVHLLQIDLLFISSCIHSNPHLTPSRQSTPSVHYKSYKRVDLVEQEWINEMCRVEICSTANGWLGLEEEEFHWQKDDVDELGVAFL